jgi:uncharacterized coiled-coil protein SlyX
MTHRIEQLSNQLVEYERKLKKQEDQLKYLMEEVEVL